ncbi:dehydrogenase/reductase SDR family member 12 isoform X2 [Tenrec ecaudatus]|uniref:dehydrogenase/reductase SDR family member 12 isoform X2 n=1 Tax=Tenrec ecaudatus TaxID=94439 RepID=UPI003F5A1FC4
MMQWGGGQSSERQDRRSASPTMSLYRTAAWFAKGLREYTRSGYEVASQDFIAGDLEIQVPGRAFLITGGNSGIGRETAIEIAKRGGTVHLVCRDQGRAEAAKVEIIRESGNQNIFLHIVDLSNPKNIWKFAEKFKKEHKLNVLINNAGCMVNKRELTEDGLEKNFATNTLGVYILTTALIPALENEHDPRVRQQVVLTERWASMHRAIHFSSMHPGWVDTPAVQLSMPSFHVRMKDRLRSAAQGADTVLWLALSPVATKHPSGQFFQDRKPVSTHLPLARTSSSPAEEERLMEALEQLAQRFT